MGKKNKFKVTPRKPKNKNGKYKIPSKHKVPYREAYPYFGFKYCIDVPKGTTFSCIKNTSEFCIIFKNLKRLSTISWEQMEQSHDFHSHPVEKYDKFPKKAKDIFNSLDNPAPYQFKIFKETRIYGFFNASNIFEIVFLDRDHTIYS